MTTITFDTYEYVRELKEAGFTEEQAKIQVKTMTKVLNEYSASQKEMLANKEDRAKIELQIAEVKKDIEIVRKEISDSKNETLKWMVAMMVAQTSILIAAIKLFSH